MRKIQCLIILLSVFIGTIICKAQKDAMPTLIEAIAQIESQGLENAKNGPYIGYLQISPGVVKECNNILKTQKSNKRYTLGDRYSKTKSIEMFYIIQEKYNPKYDMQRALQIWNKGAFSKKVPHKYIAKVMKVYKKLLSKREYEEEKERQRCIDSLASSEQGIRVGEEWL